MKAAAHLRKVVANRGLLRRHTFQAAVAPIAPCQWRSRNYSTTSDNPDATDALTILGSNETPKRRGRPRRTPEENALAAIERAKKKAELAAKRATALKKATFPIPKDFREEYEKLYEKPTVFMKPMRRPVGRPRTKTTRTARTTKPSVVKEDSSIAAKRQGVGRLNNRGQRVGSKSRSKEIESEEPKARKLAGRPKMFGPKYPTVAQKNRMAYYAGVPVSELVFGIPKHEMEGDPSPNIPADPNSPQLRRRRRTRAEMEEIYGIDPGRPKKYGPELPSKIILDQGVEKMVYLRPGRNKPFFSEEEREDKELRQAREELVKEARRQRRKEIAEYGISEDGKKKRRKTPLDEEIVVKLVNKQLNRPTGPKAYKISDLTRTARDFLQTRKKEQEEDEEGQEREWEYLLDDEGLPIVPKKTPGGDTRHKRGALPKERVRKSRWDGTTKSKDSGEEKWRAVTPQKIQSSAPTIAGLVQSGIPQPKPPTDKSLVIGEKKCADIFNNFDFSEYQGCEVIDFNPGYGIFSRELNKAINPSKHILLEHEPDFVPFLEHTCTDSSFEIIQKDFYDWNTFDDLIKDGKLNPTKLPFEEGVNKTLLVTGMLHKEIKGDRFMAQILDAMAQKTWVFRYGRIKFLLWVDEDMVARYLPRSFGRRNRAAIMVEAFTNLREIASPPPFFTWADHRFFFRMDIWKQAGHVPNKQDATTGVKYADQLTYISMPRDPPPVVFEPVDYWPPLRWAQTTLLDFTPKLTLPYLRGDVPDSEPWKFFNLFLTSSFLSRNNSMRNVLSKIGEGAEQMFETEESLKKFPDLADKPAVHVSVEELVALAQAYEFWPWRNDDPFLGTDMRLSRPGMLEELEDAQMVQ
ncbi:Mitochondrial transcription factor 1 [Orbilia oligospora]|uniref:rRNA adenine N(6)-methyltransferase n=1 Tax=Orbilia oligospora TaxID=2813651 RepID=A0A7C8NRF0_ORBOL|nr:Mitochondrial transcription factor 1 [Orbilia oligospora]KAF3114202.1 Mitochondrial transcription factor 1 [Orbilia oligospora]